ncbi:MAG: cytidine deaminase, partial [Rectinemataceae bacterium]|nr:cytidine deaminase [Rectinemataceae bacterium]
MDRDALFALAMQAAQTSYSPYSHFRVGAAIECSDGAIFTGTNIENRSFGMTICAERNAVAQAVHQGHL